jgi:hypothetical protein
VYLSQ